MFYGLMGTGLMGLPIGQRLIQSGLPLTVYNRSAEKTTPLADQGATVAASPDGVLESADCILLVLTHAKAIRDTLFTGSSRTLIAGRTFIQMGTISPQESQAIAAVIEGLEGEYLECPVLGSVPEAQAGTLHLMVGSTPEQFDRWQTLLNHLGPNPKRIGPVGSAMALKLALNQLIGSLTTSFALSLGFVQQYHLDPEDFMQILRESALYAPTFDKKLNRMLQKNFENPNFPTKHLLKDMTLFLREARELGLAVDSLDGVERILTQALDQDLGDLDYSALFSIVVPKSGYSEISED